MHIPGNRPQVVERLSVAHVAGADNLLDLAGHEQLAELVGQVRRSIGQVQITCEEGDSRSVTPPSRRPRLPAPRTYHKDQHG